MNNLGSNNNLPHFDPIVRAQNLSNAKQLNGATTFFLKNQLSVRAAVFRDDPYNDSQ